METALTRMAAEGADGRRLADAAVATWRAVFAALAPIIGQKGVAALFLRSAHLARAHHAWLSGIGDDESADPVDTLRTACLAQQPAGMAAANGALLGTFHALLSALIGPSLTDRLLEPALQTLPGGPVAQDPST